MFLLLSMTKGIPKRAWAKTPPLRSRLGETCGRAHINKTHFDSKTKTFLFYFKMPRRHKSQPLPHSFAVAVRPEQSPVGLRLHVFTEWGTRVHCVQSETLRPPSTFEALKHMQLAEFGASFKHAGGVPAQRNHCKCS